MQDLKPSYTPGVYDGFKKKSEFLHRRKLWAATARRTKWASCRRRSILTLTSRSSTSSPEPIRRRKELKLYFPPALIFLYIEFIRIWDFGILLLSVTLSLTVLSAVKSQISVKPFFPPKKRQIRGKEQAQVSGAEKIAGGAEWGESGRNGGPNFQHVPQTAREERLNCVFVWGDGTVPLLLNKHGSIESWWGRCVSTYLDRGGKRF